jgi:hypothetical protein
MLATIAIEIISNVGELAFLRSEMNTNQPSQSTKPNTK